MANHQGEIFAPPSPYAQIYQNDGLGQIMHCVIGLRDPIDVEAIKSAFSNPLITEHPMFSSLMIKGRCGRYRWQKPAHPINLDDHIVLHHYQGTATTSLEKEEAVNAYLANLAVSTSISMDKPLWELHMLLGLDSLVWRVHHSVGDGVSMVSLFLACFENVKEGSSEEIKDSRKSGAGSSDKKNKKWSESLIKRLWWTAGPSLKLAAKALWVKDRTTMRGGGKVDLWPRKVVTVRFKLEDFKAIKKAVPRVTVNDVFLGLISSGLSKYLQSINNQIQKKDRRITGMCVMNMRSVSTLKGEELTKSGTFSGWGNKTSMVLVPMKLFRSKDDSHPLEHVKSIKPLMDQKKQSYEAHLSYFTTRSTTKVFGPKMAASSFKRIQKHTTFQCTNLMGPKGEIAIAGNPVTYLRACSTCTPHAISMYFVTYAERADLQIMVAKDVIQKPDLLAKCIEESFYEIINAQQA